MKIEGCRIEKLETVMYLLNNFRRYALFIYNLQGDGMPHTGSEDELWFFQLEGSDVSVRYMLTLVGPDHPACVEGMTTALTSMSQWKKNGTAGGMGKNQQAMTEALWDCMSSLYENILRDHGWKHAGSCFGNNGEVCDIYQRPA